jgi:hypothetical protein
VASSSTLSPPIRSTYSLQKLPSARMGGRASGWTRRQGSSRRFTTLKFQKLLSPASQCKALNWLPLPRHFFPNRPRQSAVSQAPPSNQWSLSLLLQLRLWCPSQSGSIMKLLFLNRRKRLYLSRIAIILCPTSDLSLRPEAVLAAKQQKDQ